MSAPAITFNEAAHSYTVNGEAVPGVTSVLGLLNKPALPPWAAKMTVLGIARLVIEQRVPYVSGRNTVSELERLRRKLVAENIKVPEDADRDVLVAGLAQLIKRRLKARQLDHEAVTRDAIERGNAVHAALEDWINKRAVPVLGNYPEAHRGYIQGLTKFLLEWSPDFKESEQPIGSAVHGFAGTRDTVCLVERDGLGRCLLDLKTSKAVYAESMFPQVAAYEIGGVECGEPPTERQGIVRVGDGDFEVAWSVAEPEDFLSVLRAYKSQQALKARAVEATR